MVDDLMSGWRKEADDLDRLLDSLWPAGVPRCRHNHATMVQIDHKELGWFVTWQCDDCGIPLNDRPVSAEDIERGDQLPWFDRNLYLRHLGQLERRAAATQAFFGGKVRR